MGCLHPITGTKHLNQRAHARLEELDIGPAMKVERVSLDGLSYLKKLTLAAFTKLREVQVGLSSKLTEADFPKCQPSIFRLPV